MLIEARTILTTVTSAVEAARGGAIKFVCATCWLVFDHSGSRACAGCGTMSPPLGWPALPFEFRERYLFVEQLGRGGQGAVFRAYDRQSAADPWVAVKVAHRRSEALKEVFRREGRAAAMLSEHPQYFVGFRGSDFSDPAYLVLEFVPWPTLKQMHALEGNLHPLEVARLGVEILRGVRCMERRAMVHRDLKPANIFAQRCPDGSFEVKIADLGVWIDSGASDESLLGRHDDGKHFFGTPAYMSPEQIRGEVVGAASDVHAVASILWQLMTGVVPFPTKPAVGLEEKLADRLRQCKVQPPRPPSIPEDLYVILATALRFNPEERVFVDPQTLVGSDNSGHASAARGMEKALRRFIDEYAERRERALREAFARIQVLEAQLTGGEKRIATAQTLSAKAQEFRARLARLGGASTGFEVVLDALVQMEPQVQEWGTAVDAFVDAGRAEINYAVGRAEAESKRAVELQERLEAETKRAAEMKTRAEMEAQRAAEMEARARAEAERAVRAEAELSADRAERSIRGSEGRVLPRLVAGGLLLAIGLGGGFGAAYGLGSSAVTGSEVLAPGRDFGASGALDQRLAGDGLATGSASTAVPVIESGKPRSSAAPSSDASAPLAGSAASPAGPGARPVDRAGPRGAIVSASTAAVGPRPPQAAGKGPAGGGAPGAAQSAAGRDPAGAGPAPAAKGTAAAKAGSRGKTPPDKSAPAPSARSLDVGTPDL